MKGKDIEEVEVSEEDLEKVSAWLDRHEHYYDELETEKYDGVAGLPPEWVPESTRWRFRQIRNYFLERCGYSPELLVERIDYYSVKGMPLYDNHPNGRPVDIGAWNLLLGFLANLKWVSQLDPIDGLRELSGEYAAQGYAAAENRPNKQKSRLRMLAELTYKKLKNRALLGYRDGEPSLNDVIDALKSNDKSSPPVIDDIDRDEKVIYSLKLDGTPAKSTKFTSLGKMLSSIKQEYRNKE